MRTRFGRVDTGVASATIGRVSSDDGETSVEWSWEPSLGSTGEALDTLGEEAHKGADCDFAYNYSDKRINRTSCSQTIYRLNDSLKYTIHEGITVSGIVDSRKGEEGDTPTDTGIDIKFRFTFP